MRPAIVLLGGTAGRGSMMGIGALASKHVLDFGITVGVAARVIEWRGTLAEDGKA